MTELTERQMIVKDLCQDLNAQGWDQLNKLWYLRGEPGDEWLEYVGDFNTAPEYRLFEMIGAGDFPTDASGVVFSQEGWDYPSSLRSTFSSERAMYAYWRLVPPSEHPEKINVRQLVLAARDGAVVALKHWDEADDAHEWALMDADTASPVGVELVDAARAVVGLNDRMAQIIQKAKALGESAIEPEVTAQSSTKREALAKINDIVTRVLAHEITPEDGQRELFRAMPDDVREEMLSDMPQELKDAFARHLSDEERRRYGL